VDSLPNGGNIPLFRNSHTSYPFLLGDVSWSRFAFLSVVTKEAGVQGDGMSQPVVDMKEGAREERNRFPSSQPPSSTLYDEVILLYYF
jgi:hypothetical protein